MSHAEYGGVRRKLPPQGALPVSETLDAQQSILLTFTALFYFKDPIILSYDYYCVPRVLLWLRHCKSFFMPHQLWSYSSADCSNTNTTSTTKVKYYPLTKAMVWAADASVDDLAAKWHNYNVCSRHLWFHHH